jgi:hypothetical protein
MQSWGKFLIEPKLDVAERTHTITKGETDRGPCGGLTTDNELCDARHRH